MLMRLNQAKDMSINVAIDCLYSSMTFTATNEQEQRRPERTVSSLILIHTYTCVHMSIQIIWVFLLLLLLSCCSLVSIFVRFHMDLVDDFMENLFFVMLILSFIGISKVQFFSSSGEWMKFSLSLVHSVFFFFTVFWVRYCVQIFSFSYNSVRFIFTCCMAQLLFPNQNPYDLKMLSELDKNKDGRAMKHSTQLTTMDTLSIFFWLTRKILEYLMISLCARAHSSRAESLNTVEYIMKDFGWAVTQTVNMLLYSN